MADEEHGFSRSQPLIQPYHSVFGIEFKCRCMREEDKSIGR